MMLYLAVVFVLSLYAAYLIFLGGVARWFGQRLFLVVAALLVLNTLAIGCFSVVYHLELIPYPWAYEPLYAALPWPLKYVLSDYFAASVLSSIVLPFVPLLYRSGNTSLGDAHFSSVFEIKKSGLYAKQGILLGQAFGQAVVVPGNEGVLVVAPTGAGKTSCIAVPNLLSWQGSGVFNDLKGELYRLTAEHRKTVLDNTVMCWSPAQRGGAGYNPLFYVSNDPDLRIRDLQLIAEMLIPESRLGDAFWYQSSREVFLLLALYLLDTKAEATLQKIHDLAKQQGFSAWLNVQLVDHPELSKACQQNAYSFLGADERTRRNILKDFQSRMSLFSDPLVCAATNQNDFDFRLLRKQKMSIYVHIPDADKSRLSPILTLFWAQLLNALSEQEPQADEPYQVLAMMDEFGNMARINKLKDGMSFLRAYHVRPVIMVQYLGQIVSVYGREDAKGFLNAKVKLCFALSDLEDAAFFSKLLGNRTVKVVAKSGGERAAKHTSLQARPLMSADKLARLPRAQGVVVLEGCYPLRVRKCMWFA